MIKKYKKQLVISTLITLIPVLAGLLLWNSLPSKIAVHFGMNGTADGWAGKTFVVLIFPVILAVVHLFTCMVVLNDPKKENIGNKLLYICFATVPVISCVCLFSIYALALGNKINISMISNILIGILFIIIGNYMTKNHQNYTVGIKLPWTLNSEENWNKTHRMASKLWMAGGIVLIMAGFTNINWLIIVDIIVVTFIPIVYSFILYKKGI